jgi:hypothetical protein
MSTGAKRYIEKPLKFNDSEFIDDFKMTIDDIFKKKKVSLAREDCPMSNPGKSYVQTNRP